MTQATPSFLGRTRKMKTGAVAGKSNQASANAPNAAANSAIPQSARVNNKAGASGVTEGKKGRGKGARGMQGVEAPSAASLAVVAKIKAMASRPELIDAMEMMHPGAVGGAVAAMMQSAQVAGPGGAADRSALWRVVGAPWVGEGGGKMARDLGAALGAAYGEAVSRLEGHRRHKPVTVAEPMTLEGALDRAS